MLKHKNSYVIEDANNCCWYFYFESDEGINYIVKSAEEKNPQSENLISTSIDEFSVDIDKDFIYLIYCDIDNELNMMTWNGRVWSKNKLIKNPVDGIIFNPGILTSNGLIHIFYEISSKKDNFYYLVHHFWNKSRWSSYTIAKSNSKIFYFVTKGPSGLYCVYIENGQLLYTVYNYLSNGWTKPTAICNIKDTENPYIYAYVNTSNNSVNIIYSDNDKLCYIRRTAGSWLANSENTKILFSDNAQFPAVFNISGNLWAMWYSKKFLYACISADSGDTWSEPFKIPSEADVLSTCIFISLTKPGLMRVRAFNYAKNPYHLILIDDIFNPYSSGFSYFTISINQIQQYISHLNKALQSEKNKNAELVKNMQKMELYYKDLNAHYNLLKSSYGNLLKTVDELKREYETLKKENMTLKEEVEKANCGLIKKIFPWGRS
ncbi:hypothetical protein [Calorimonas adulescens]|uniref:Sialidase domain-containing protein n=1 Tax=Calorimonas adulescens TaxID=2606906 RepID=A0A5D8QCY3_9THEO|nr:hypothetical protein [Calorimonas adulescens]TZE82267.1 hypothetical protein FWJ32_05810 [Calorimonas adulescens]